MKKYRINPIRLNDRGADSRILVFYLIVMASMVGISILLGLT